MKDLESDEWVEVAAVGQEEEASLIAGLFQSEDIPCEVEGPSATPWPENLGSFGLSRVMVPPERAGEARALLARREREFRERPPTEEGDPSGGEQE
jgi:hypothetical protein